MTRRAFWLTVGFGLGIAAAARARRQVDAANGVSARLAERLRRDVADAVADGRAEMQGREARLRRVFAAPNVDGDATPGQ
ncbi:MAG TPA: hypothetical protein VI462_00925 [Acidimicrobiia bacterium]